MESLLKVQEEITQQEDNILPMKRPFSVLPGGKGTDLPPNWLKTIPELYLVWTREKPSQSRMRVVPVNCLQILFHAEKCTKFVERTDPRNPVIFWVHTEDFSRTHECVEIKPITMADLVPNEEQEVDYNGTSDREVRPGVVVHPPSSESSSPTGPGTE